MRAFASMHPGNAPHPDGIWAMLLSRGLDGTLEHLCMLSAFSVD